MNMAAAPAHLTSLLVALTVLSVTSAAEAPAANFEGKETLLRPEGYREWVFVGSSLGLRYNRDLQKGAADSKDQKFHNVYIDRAAFREFSRTGKFPDGTVLILEIASAEAKAEPGLQGSYEKEFTAMEAAVKDSKRFADGWAYFSFDGENGKKKDKATPFAKNSCFDCHHEKAATDNVFTQFYPVLRAEVEKRAR